MALTNREIIISEMALHGITEHVETFASWKSKGYHIKKGSKALFTTQIWKPCTITVKKGNAVEKQKKLILVKASFFGLSQVEKEVKKESTTV